MKGQTERSRKPGRRALAAANRRDISVKVRMNAAEYAARRKKAEKVHMGLSSFLREASIKAQIIAPPSLENREAYMELGRVGQLLNQAIKAIHQGKLTNLDPAFLKALNEQIRLLRLELLGVTK